MKSRLLVVCGLLFLLVSMTCSVMADPGNGNGWGQGVGGGQNHKAPELDPGSLVGGITLLACGLMILQDRKRRK
jgi:hypothetical protein